jgi:ribose 5-phosphate isomerase B
MERIAVASDHAGFKLKQLIISYLQSREYQVIDFGCYSDQSCDYPDYAHPLASAIEEGKASKGIVFCGTGNGINMTVNKHQGIRSAICWTKEIALLARNHNDANICSIPARFISEAETFEIVDVFLLEKFDGGRHIKRIEKIPVN